MKSTLIVDNRQLLLNSEKPSMIAFGKAPLTPSYNEVSTGGAEDLSSNREHPLEKDHSGHKGMLNVA